MDIYILVILFMLTVICLHLNVISRDKRGFNIVVRVVLIFLLLQAAVEFTARMLPEQYSYVGWAAPFSLIYGPLLYIGYLSSKGDLQEKKKIIIHVLPFLLAMFCYIIFLLFPPPAADGISIVYASVLYTSIALSWLIYSVWVICLLGSNQKKMIGIEFRNLISAIAIILFTMAVFYMSLVYTRTIRGIKTDSLATMLFLYLGMLSTVVFIYRYMIHRFRESLTDTRDALRPILRKEEVASQKLEYQKSSLKEEVMVVYSKKVTAFIESGAYLDIDLSLGKIATELKIPKHHLSQLFSQHYKQGFLEYINMLRIRHACSILNNPKINVNIADLAEQCGFKSKPSFYRNFKSIVGMTPTEFQSSLLK